MVGIPVLTLLWEEDPINKCAWTLNFRTIGGMCGSVVGSILRVQHAGYCLNHSRFEVGPDTPSEKEDEEGHCTLIWNSSYSPRSCSNRLHVVCGGTQVWGEMLLITNNALDAVRTHQKLNKWRNESEPPHEAINYCLINTFRGLYKLFSVIYHRIVR